MEQNTLRIESLDIEGRGVGHLHNEDGTQGKVIFVEGALPGERVQVSVWRRKNQWEQGTLAALQRESSQRVVPRCPHFGLHPQACGGCKMQHLQPAAQVAAQDAAEFERAWDNRMEADWLKEVESKGMIVSKPDLKPFREAVKTVYEQYTPKYGKDLIESILNTK